MDKSWHREAVGVAYSSGINLSIDLPNGLRSRFVLITWRARRA
jgi:hypothetical protein